jgi:hypothetical protein
VKAVNVPLDDDLLNALPADKRDWLRSIGLTGKVDFEGDITAEPDGRGLGYTLDIKLRDGTAWPGDGTFTVTDATASLTLKPERLDLRELKGRRGDATLAATGEVTWGGGQPPKVSLDVTADALALDAGLYQAIPEGARKAWDAVRPKGSVDVKLKYAGVARRGDPPPPDFTVEIRPRDLTLNWVTLPYELRQVTGAVVVTPADTELRELAGRHGDATVKLDGRITRADNKAVVAVTATKLKVDADLLAALPKAMSESITAAALGGEFDVAVAPLVYTPDVATELNMAIATTNAAMKTSVPVGDISGVVRGKFVLRDGRLDEFSARADVKSLVLGGRPITDLSCDLLRPRGDDGVQIENIHGITAGGELAGRAACSFPDRGNSRYALNLLVRDAQVQQLVGETDQKISGRVAASVTMEGQFADANTRRGRGDVLVEGKELYRVPVLLGLLQVTNLSLPINQPFKRATASYSLVGNRMTLEGVDLSAEGMRMSGRGVLDFGKGTVSMAFTTDAGTWMQIPIVKDLVQGARDELLQIRIKGSLQQPKVEAGMFNSVTTTIDEVLKGGG